jgi:hypothetical protein
LARASAFQAEGRGFESRFPLQNSSEALTNPWSALVAQAVEHLHGKQKVSGSIPLVGSIVRIALGRVVRIELDAVTSPVVFLIFGP